MSKGLVIIGLMATLGLATVACGGPTPEPPTEPGEVEVLLSEFRIELSQTTFALGTPVRFAITNAGAISHEFLIEPRDAIDEPLEAEGREAEVEEDQLPAGASLAFDWTFSEPGDYQVACHLPGHYEAGMVAPIVVE